MKAMPMSTVQYGGTASPAPRPVPSLPTMQPRNGFSLLPRLPTMGTGGGQPFAPDMATPLPFRGGMPGGGVVQGQPFAPDLHSSMPFRGSVFGGVGGGQGMVSGQSFAPDLSTPFPFRGAGMQMGGPMGAPAMQPRPGFMPRFVAPPVFRR